ncbi:MAG: hypothetical protein HOV80_30745 [Polyangiaceae bacterium]|nr:hypothetical protein [Polyangiaceae bacterium]
MSEPSITSSGRGVPSSTWLVIAIVAAGIWPPFAAVVILFSWSSEQGTPGSIDRVGAITLAAIPGLVLRALVDVPVTTPSPMYFGELSSFTLFIGRCLLWTGLPLIGMALAAWWLRDSAPAAVARRTRIAALVLAPTVVLAALWARSVSSKPVLDQYVASLTELATAPAQLDTQTDPLGPASQPVLATCDAGGSAPLFRPDVSSGDPGLCVVVGNGQAVLVDAFAAWDGWRLKKDDGIGLYVLHRDKSTGRGFAINDGGVVFELRKTAVLDRIRPSDAVVIPAAVATLFAALLLYIALRARRRKQVLDAALSGTLHADGTLEVDEAGPRPVAGVRGIAPGPVTVLRAKLEPQSYREAGRAEATILPGPREEHVRRAEQRAVAATSAALALVVLLGTPLVTHAVGALFAPMVRAHVSPTEFPPWARRPPLSKAGGTFVLNPKASSSGVVR